MKLLLVNLISNSHGREDLPEKPFEEDPKNVGSLGMIFMLLPFSVLVFTAIVGYFWVQSIALAGKTWIQIGTRIFPISLFFSTISIILSAAAFFISGIQLKEDNVPLYRRLIVFTAGFAALFILLQTAAWIEMIGNGLTPKTPTFFSFAFYFFTILHGFLALPGSFFLARFSFRSSKEEITGKLKNSHLTISIYWYFLTVSWVALFSVLYFY